MDELVRGFIEGQVSRRVFIRRLVAGGVTLTGAVAYADLLHARPAAAMEYHAVYVDDYAFSPPGETLSGPGDYVNWDWLGGSGHTVTDTSGNAFFDSSPLPNAYGGWMWVTAFGRSFWASGTWPYDCKDTLHTPMTGVIHVPMRLSATSGKAGKTITVEFGTVNITTEPYLYHVQVRRPDDAWKDWVGGGTSPTKNYTARTVGKHRFRARLKNTTNGQSADWSPVATFTAR